MNKVFVSGVYRPEEDARNIPTRTINEIVEKALEIKRRKKAQHQRYDNSGSRAHQRAYARMVGSE